MTHPTLKSVFPAIRLAITVRGVVQGVGFRPFVYNSARAKGLSGWVLNQADAVRMEVQGERAALDEFVESLRNAHPPQARIDEIEIREVPCEKDSPATFEIRTSVDNAAPRPSDSGRSGHVRPVSGRNPRSGRAPLSLSIYELHQLRAEVVDHRAIAVRSAADVDGSVSRCARIAARSTKIPPTGVFTPSPSPAQSAGRTWN